MQPGRQLVTKGAEADIYLIEWCGRKAISKVRAAKPYRHPELDQSIRRHRTLHEANFMSAAKKAGIETPFIYFVDPKNAEIIMEYVEGKNVRDIVSLPLCREIGRYSARLHSRNIIHGDLTSNASVIRNVTTVFKDGVGYDSAKLLAAVKGRVGID